MTQQAFSILASPVKFLNVLIFALLPSGVWGADVSLRQDWGQERWLNYPDNIDKPIGEWKGDAFKVKVAVHWNSSISIDDSSASAAVKNNSLVLCYREELAPPPSSDYAVGALAPVILEFTITGIPKRQYVIKVSRQCK